MKVIVCKDYQRMSVRAADLVAAQIKMKPDCVLGLATGSTPEGMYAELVKMYHAGEIDFSAVKSVNLDEYYPIAPDNDQSYRYFMDKNLFDHVNIDKNNTNVPDGQATDTNAESLRYEALIKMLGGIDLQVLGIGQNGHIGFNEPGEVLFPITHVTDLTPSTIKANSRFFAGEEDVPKQALTMGLRTILCARKIIVLASGKEKHDAVQKMLSGLLTTQVPASFLMLHPDVTLICDKAAYEG